MPNQHSKKDMIYISDLEHISIKLAKGQLRKGDLWFHLDHEIGIVRVACVSTKHKRC
jgi:hypothetical protein